MRDLARNLRPFWYCEQIGIAERYDEYGNTGEYRPLYGDPIRAVANISPAGGYAQTEIFGNLENYDKVIVTADINCPINEDCILFIDKEPDMGLPVEPSDCDYTITIDHRIIASRVYDRPKYDYVVRRVARGLDSVSIAVRKVEVT